MPVSREHVLKTYAISKDKGTAVGIRLKGRHSLLITTIDQIIGECFDSTYVIVNHQSIYGETLSTNCFSLSEIEQLCNLRVQFDDPFYEYLRVLRTNIRTIREETGFEKRTSIIR